MATIAGTFFQPDKKIDVLSGTPRAHTIDRCIYVFTAALFIPIVLTGFIPQLDHEDRTGPGGSEARKHRGHAPNM